MEEQIIAQRIRQIRNEKELTLEEVARRTGFTKGLLSKIENNKVSPPVSTLAKIARALDVSLGDLFSAADAQPIKIVRKAERQRYHPESSPGGQSVETLISGFQKQKMEPLIISIDNPSTYKVKHYNHPGQEFILVLEGTMKYYYDGQEFTLSEGDAVYFDASSVHGPLPIRGKKVKYLSVMCS
ncbi:MAG: helix-turn-helix domain-containing protein [Candidatus Saccharibacteria bacterium]